MCEAVKPYTESCSAWSEKGNSAKTESRGVRVTDYMIYDQPRNANVSDTNIISMKNNFGNSDASIGASVNVIECNCESESVNATDACLSESCIQRHLPSNKVIGVEKSCAQQENSYLWSDILSQKLGTSSKNKKRDSKGGILGSNLSILLKRQNRAKQEKEGGINSPRKLKTVKDIVTDLEKFNDSSSNFSSDFGQKTIVDLVQNPPKSAIKPRGRVQSLITGFSTKVSASQSRIDQSSLTTRPKLELIGGRLLSSCVRGGKQDLKSPNGTSVKKKTRSSKSLKLGESKCQKNKITKYIEKFDVPTEKVGTEVGRQTR